MKIDIDKQERGREKNVFFLKNVFLKSYYWIVILNFILNNLSQYFSIYLSQFFVLFFVLFCLT